MCEKEKKPSNLEWLADNLIIISQIRNSHELSIFSEIF